MSHRKFRQPRHGNLAFLPKKRCTRSRAKVKTFPYDKRGKDIKPHLTAFIGVKAGMTHIVRDVDRPGAKLHKKEVVEPVTIIETPPMVAVGIVGYKDTPRGNRQCGSYWAQHLSTEVKRRFYRRWYRCKRKAYTRYARQFTTKTGQLALQKRLTRIRRNADSIRVLLHTQQHRLKKTSYCQKKAALIEVQVNGGKDIFEKLQFAQGLLEKEVTVGEVFAKDEMCDAISITKGKGLQGVTTRWGTRHLPRKTHKGLRKVACIGSWHPARVAFSVARSGQMGYHHRVDTNKKIYRIGAGLRDENGKENASTEFDLTKKAITPLGGFPHFGTVKNAFVMIRGSCPAPKKRFVVLRRPLRALTNRDASEVITLKFIDTSSKMGTGKFQTKEEKLKYMGLLKRDLLKQQAAQ